MLRSLALVWLCVSCLGLQIAHAAARNDVLVVVNDNSVDSPRVGQYYAQQRDINPANVVHIRVPNQFIVSWNDFRSLRDQILRLGICPTLAAAARPASCGTWSTPIYAAADVVALTAATPIRYIVLTRGVPTRMRVENSALVNPTESTSVDNYLRFWLARYLSSDVQLKFLERANALAYSSLTDWRTRIRPVEPAQDREYVVGRIDGLDLDSAKALVDRTLHSEGAGFHGKVYSSQDQIVPWRWHLALFDALGADCADDANNYLAFPETLAAGKTPVPCSVKLVKGETTLLDEAGPGMPGSRQPIADNAVVYFGHLDGQTFSGGFNEMLNWRKSASCSATLCATSTDPAACRAVSADPFKEIDTRCVGVADGFMGYQFISYSAANFNAWPTAWETPGTEESDAPRIVTNDGADDSTSAFFEKTDEVAAPACYPYTAAGILDPVTMTCRATGYIAMSQSLPTAVIDAANPQAFKLEFFSRQSGPLGTIVLQATARFVFNAPTNGCPAATAPSPAPPAAPTTCVYTVTKTANVSNSSTWQRFEYTIAPPAIAGSTGVSRLTLTFNGTMSGSRLGLDAVSLTHLASGTQLVTNGSFTGGHLQTATGDYAANFLSRLGGIAYWGSLSHHESSGWSFQGTPLRTLAFLMRGLPLGDAVWLGELHNSGVFYGDPLYSPTKIRLMPLPDPEGRIAGSTSIQASIQQGTVPKPKLVSLSVCRGGDLTKIASSFAGLTCDASYGWRTLPDTTVTTTDSAITLGVTTDPSWFPEMGDYTLRLQVASQDPTTLQTTTIDDYYPIKYRYSDQERSALYSITGRLVTRDGEPMPYMNVLVGGLPVIATTDLQGRFVLSPLRLGTYVLTIGSSPGCTFTPINGSALITISNSSVTRDFRCNDTGGRVLGTIADSAGKPIPDVLLNLSGAAGSGETYSNVNGQFETSSLPDGTYTVTAFREGWTFPTQTVTLQGQRITRNVTGSNTAPRILGYVRDAQGQGVAGAYLYGSGESAYSVTNRDGYFESTVPAAGSYQVAVDADGFALKAVSVTTNTSATVTLEPVGRQMVSGYVSNASGGTVSGYRVTMSGTGPAMETVTSASGFYRFAQVLNGAYTVEVRRPNSESVGARPITVSGADLIEVNFVDKR